MAKNLQYILIMKSILLVTVLSLVLACNNSTPTAKPTDLDRTDNDDTAPIVTDSVQSQSNQSDTLRLDSTKNKWTDYEKAFCSIDRIDVFSSM